MAGLAASILLFGGAPATAQEIVTLSTRPGVTQSFFIANLPQNPQAIAILFPGSGGLIRLRQEDGQIKFGQNNFLVRSRGEFVKRGVVAAILDAPSDYQTGWGMGDEFRLGEDHFTDVSAVVADLGKRFPGLPLFLIGTSRGTISAAALGARFGSGLSGCGFDFNDVPRSRREIQRTRSWPEPLRLHNHQGARLVRPSRRRSMRGDTL